VSAARIRLVTARDAPAIHAIYAPIVAATFISFELAVPGVAEIERRIGDTLPRFPWLVFEDGEELLGYAYACEHRSRAAYQWSVDVSCYVHERARRRGIARALYEALFRVLARQGFTNAFAGIALPNAASVAMHAAAGFEALGRYRDVGYKLGQWHDTLWMQRTLAPSPANPEAPRPLEGLAAHELGEAIAG
jgi:L-amino acid N-acyltransferase YncA